MTTTESFPVLYILMRKDLKSMNPGKAMAQASHAANAFVHSNPEMPDAFFMSGSTKPHRDLALCWCLLFLKSK